MPKIYMPEDIASQAEFFRNVPYLNGAVSEGKGHASILVEWADLPAVLKEAVVVAAELVDLYDEQIKISKENMRKDQKSKKEALDWLRELKALAKR